MLPLTGLGYTASIATYAGENTVRIPPVHMMVHEYCAGGYSLSVELRPRVKDAAAALHAVIDQGISPGGSALVTLKLDERQGAVRSWPAIVTGIATRECRRGEKNPPAVVTLVDPFTAYGNRALWLGFAGIDLAELLGAALSSAAGGDGAPSKTPVIPGIPPIEIRCQVRESIRTLPYVVSAGETLLTWMDSLSALLKIRVELVGLGDGKLIATITDKSPRVSGLNDKGAIPLQIDMRRAVSSRNVHVRAPRALVWPRERGGLLDVPSQGTPSLFGREGAVARVLQSAGMTREEGKVRVSMDIARGKSSQVRIELSGAQPGLLPGRMVSFEDPPMDRDGNALTPSLVFGASRWQIMEVAHLFVHGSYRCSAEAEKSGAPWHPTQAAVPREMRILGGTIDDGESKSGEAVKHDRLGCLPVRPAFSGALKAGAGSSWSPTLPLVSCFPSGGWQHGFVSDARQGDVCRIRVHTPLFAEIAGFMYRDDRTVKPVIRDKTGGFVLHQETESWRGVAFEASDVGE